MTTSESLDSARDVVQVQADWNKNAFTDDGSVSDVRIKQEVNEPVNDSQSPTVTLSMMNTDGGQQQTDTSNVKERDDTVVVKVEWTYEKDEYNESNTGDERDNRPDVQITQLTEEMSNEHIAEVQESMDTDVVCVTSVSAEYVPSRETNESLNIPSNNTTAIVSDVTLATPDVNSTDSMQVVVTEPFNSVIADKTANEMETSKDVDCTVSMATDKTSFVDNEKDSVGAVQSIRSNETISTEDRNLDNNIIVTNVTTENVNNYSVLAGDTLTVVTDSVAEPETVSVVIDNVMSTTEVPLVVPGVIQTINVNETSIVDNLPVIGEITTSDGASESNDMKPEIVTMVVVNNGDNNNDGQQEFTEHKVVSVKPNEEKIKEKHKKYQKSPEALLTSKQAMLAYEFSDDGPEEQTPQLPLKKSKGAEGHLSLRTIKVFPTHVTCGNNVRARIRRRARQKKGLKKFIFDNQKSLSNELTKLQMSDTHDIVTALDLAPPTKKLMMLPSDVVELFCLPGRRISSETLAEMYTRNLVTHTCVDDTEGNTIYVLDKEKQDRKEKEKEDPSPKTKKLITGRPEGLSVQVIGLQLRDTSDLVSALNLAPPTKQLMHWKETHDVKNLLSHPGRSVNSRTFSKLFTKNMVTKFDVAEDEEEREDNLELEPLNLSECENGAPENAADTTTNTVNDTNGSVTT